MEKTVAKLRAIRGSLIKRYSRYSKIKAVKKKIWVKKSRVEETNQKMEEKHKCHGEGDILEIQQSRRSRLTN